MVFTNVLGPPLVACLGGQVGGTLYLPWFPLTGIVSHLQAQCPQPLHQKHLIPLQSIPPQCFNFYLDPWYHTGCHYHLFHTPVAEGYWLWFSVASVLPLTAV